MADEEHFLASGKAGAGYGLGGIFALGVALMFVPNLPFWIGCLVAFAACAGTAWVGFKDIIKYTKPGFLLAGLSLGEFALTVLLILRVMSGSAATQDQTPNILLAYQDHKLIIYNYGQQDIFLWGNSLEGFPADIEKEPVIIPYVPPPETGYYYLYTNNLYEDMTNYIGKNGQKLIPFYLYLKDQNGVKYTGNFDLLITMVNGTMNIDTQEHGIVKDNWTINPPTLRPAIPRQQ